MNQHLTPPRGEPAVRASGLVKDFGDMRAVDHIELEVARGEIFGVLGPNGAGKTTVLRMLATLLPIDAGEAQLFGVDVRRQPHMVRQLVGVTGQYASVDENLTARENLWLFARLQGIAPARARQEGGTREADMTVQTSLSASVQPKYYHSGSAAPAWASCSPP